MGLVDDKLGEAWPHSFCGLSLSWRSVQGRKWLRLDVCGGGLRTGVEMRPAIVWVNQ